MDVKGLAKCYRTADGVGVGCPTMDADTKTKKQGMSWKWAIVALLGILGLAIIMPGAIAKILSSVLLGGAKTVASGFAVTNAPPVVQSYASVTGAVGPQTVYVTNVVISSRPVGVFRSNDVAIAGALKTEAGWSVSLRDGRTLLPGQYYRVVEIADDLAFVEIDKDGQRAVWKSAPALPPEGRQGGVR